MTQDRREMGDDAFLDALFDAARDAPPAPVSPALQARLMADAVAWQPRAPEPLSWLARIRQALAEVGGLPGLASVTAAGVAGLWIGVAPPASAEGLVGTLAEQVFYGATEGDFPGVGQTDLYSIISSDLE